MNETTVINRLICGAPHVLLRPALHAGQMLIQHIEIERTIEIVANETNDFIRDFVHLPHMDAVLTPCECGDGITIAIDVCTVFVAQSLALMFTTAVVVITVFDCHKPLGGIEPAASSLPEKNSTIETIETIPVFGIEPIRDPYEGS